MVGQMKAIMIASDCSVSSSDQYKHLESIYKHYVSIRALLVAFRVYFRNLSHCFCYYYSFLNLTNKLVASAYNVSPS